MQPISGSTRRSKQRLGLALLLMLLFRAYVPVGYMPSAGSPWELQICPEGLVAGHHHEHHGNQPDFHDHFAHCPFGALPAVGPAMQSLPIPSAPQPLFAAREAAEPTRLSFPLQRAQRARGPPHARQV